MTGIDRVEFAYLRALCARDDPLFAIARISSGYALLDKRGAKAFLAALEAPHHPPLDLLARLSPHRPKIIRARESTMRTLARATCVPVSLNRLMRRHLPKGTKYINTGHANLTERMLRALHSIDAQITVFLHDVIPLEAPDLQREGSVARFRSFLSAIEAYADLVIFNSEDTKRRALSHLPAKSTLVAHLGVELAVPDPLPDTLKLAEPYFLSVGTIEPRKNHTLLLDLWEAWDEPIPNLILAGSRGWKNEETFERLDRGVPGVIERPNLSDGQLATLLDGAQAMLFPSHMEGFGLPVLEAAARGTPVVAQPLPVFREVLGDIPLYADAHDPARWTMHLRRLMLERPETHPLTPPSWDAHFNAVLRMT